MKSTKINEFFSAVRPWLLPVAVIAFIWFFGKRILQGFGLLPDDSVEEREKKLAASVADQQTVLIDAGVKLSQPVAYWQALANSVYQSLKYSAISDNKFTATSDLRKVKNDLDMYTLIAAFGVRQEYFFGVGVGGLQDMVTFVNGNLYDSQISALNNYFNSVGMKFRF